MSNPIQAAKEIAAPDPGGEPEPPCKHAEFQKRHPCRGHMWLCANADCQQEGLVVRGNDCRRCEEREKP